MMKVQSQLVPVDNQDKDDYIKNMGHFVDQCLDDEIGRRIRST